MRQPQHHASSPSQVAEGKKPSITAEDIQLVQDLIERCLQLYMDRNEVVQTLRLRAEVEPTFTKLVWLKLEEQNPDFFRSYYTRLKLKAHIATFNELLEQQAELMRKTGLLPPPPPQLYPPQVVPAQHLDPIPEEPTSSGLQRTTSSSRSDMVLEDGREQQCSSAAGMHPDPLYPFSQTTDIPSLPLGGDYTPHEQQAMECLPGEGEAMHGMPAKDSLGNMSRIFSLSDLTADIGPNGKMPRNFSLSDLTVDLDIASLSNFPSAFVSADTDYLQTPEQDGFDEDPMLDFTE